MRIFQEILEKGRKHFEDRVFQRRVTTGFRLTLIPASLLMLACLFSFRWDLFSLGFLAPLVLVAVIFKRQESLSPVIAARYLDQNFHLRDVLATAHEFHSREENSSVIRNLLSDADQSSGAVSIPGKNLREQIERLLLLLIFILLVLLNLYFLFSKPSGSGILGEIQSQIDKLPSDSDLRKDLQSGLDKLKSETDKNGQNSQIDKMSGMISQSQKQGDLEKAGKSLQKNDSSSKVGEALEKGDMGKASEEAGKMGEELGKGLSQNQKQSLGKALREAAQRLDKPSQKDLKDALEKMEKNLDKPGELKKAAKELSKGLEDLARKQETLKKIEEKLESMKNQGEEKGPSEGPDQKDGSKGTGKEKKNGEKGGEKGKEKGSGEKGSGKEKSDGGKENSQSPGNGKKSDKDSSGKSEGDKSSPSGEKGKSGKDPKDSNAKGGKGAGGVLNDDPQKLLKNGKSKPIKAGDRLLDNKSPEENATMAQMLADYEKGAVLSDKDKIKLKIQQETLAKSREIDEFSQHHRIPETFRTFLKDFYSIPPSKPSKSSVP